MAPQRHGQQHRPICISTRSSRSSCNPTPHSSPRPGTSPGRHRSSAAPSPCQYITRSYRFSSANWEIWIWCISAGVPCELLYIPQHMFDRWNPLLDHLEDHLEDTGCFRALCACAIGLCNTYLHDCLTGIMKNNNIP